jgi:hypothetical protein
MYDDAANAVDALTPTARRLAAVRHIVVRGVLRSRADCQPTELGPLGWNG